MMKNDGNDDRRKTVRVGRQFASTLATRLDAHPRSAEAVRQHDERVILEMAREIFAQTQPDPLSVSALTHLIETHTTMHGFSRTIYEEVRKIQQRRISKSVDASSVSAAASPTPKKLDASQFLAKAPELRRFPRKV